MKRCVHSFAVFAAMVALLLPVDPAASDTFLTFSTSGGDAWTFRKRVEGIVADGACDDVRITTPSGTFLATRFGNRFAATVDLREGENEVGALCQSNGVGSTVSSEQHWRVRLADRPKAWARATLTHAGLALDASDSELAPVRSVPIVRYEWRMHPAPAGSLSEYEGRRLVLYPAWKDGDYRAELTVTDALGRKDKAAATIRIRGGQPMPVDPTRDHAPWVDEAVVYGAVPFLFDRGGLRGMTVRLDAIAGLGAKAVWLSPITESVGEDFGYAVTDHFSLRRPLGTEEDLRAFIAAAHERGLRVILDLVPNHMSDKHSYYIDVERQGEKSPYADFFDRDEQRMPTHYFDWLHLKNLNLNNPEVQHYVIEASTHWVREFDVDGFRVDVSWGIRERAPDFWPRWRAELKRIKPDLFLLAEASAWDPYYFVHGFDAAYDWTGKLGEWAWQAAFDDHERTARHLRQALAAYNEGGPHGALVFRFLENNDTGARFVTRYGPDVTRVAATMLFTLPGVPLIYVGQEVGAEFEPYGERRPVDWNSDPNRLCNLYRRLIELRRTMPSLYGHELRLLESVHSDMVLAYERPGRSAEDSLVIVLNFSAIPVAVGLDDGDVAALTHIGKLEDFLSGEVLSVTPESPQVSLPAFGARVLGRPHGAVPKR